MRFLKQKETMDNIYTLTLFQRFNDVLLIAKNVFTGDTYDILEFNDEGIFFSPDIPSDFGLPINENGEICIKRRKNHI